MRPIRGSAAVLSAIRLSGGTSAYPRLVMRWRLFLAGLFLTPFVQVVPVPGVGVSFGDLLLATGGLLLLLQPSPERARAWWAFAATGWLLIGATMISALVNPTVGATDTLSLLGPYIVVLVVIPAALFSQPQDRLLTAALAFVTGIAASVVLGLAIVTFLPGLESTLAARGWLDVSVTGRLGLFSGIGELSKMSAMSLPLLYLLVRRGRIHSWTAGGALAALMVSQLVSRSGLGMATALVVATTLALGAVATRGRHGPTAAPKSSRVGMLLVGSAVTAVVAWQLAARGQDYGAQLTQRVYRPLAETGIESIGSGEVRVLLLQESWGVIGDHIFFGIGPGLYAKESAFHIAVHVVPMMLWAEIGLLGLLAWIGFVVALMAQVRSRFWMAPLEAVVAASVLVGFLVTCASLPYMHGRSLMMPILLAFALLAAETQRKSGSGAATIPRGTSHRV